MHGTYVPSGQILRHFKRKFVNDNVTLENECVIILSKKTIVLIWVSIDDFARNYASKART